VPVAKGTRGDQKKRGNEFIPRVRHYGGERVAYEQTPKSNSAKRFSRSRYPARSFTRAEESREKSLGPQERTGGVYEHSQRS